MRHVSVCVYVCACICVCLIGVVSISKRPDSHPPSPSETKADQLMMLRMILDQLSMFERHTASVRDTVNVFPLEVLCAACINKDIC